MSSSLRAFDTVVLVADQPPGPSIRRRIAALRALGVRVRTVRDRAGAVDGSDAALVLDAGSGGVGEALDEQLRHHRPGRVPDPDADPAWTVRETGEDPLRHRVAEALFTLGEGGFATRGAVEESRPGSVPMVLASGAYTGRGPAEHLLAGPLWTGLDIEPCPVRDQHVLDLRSGTLTRTEDADDHPVRTLRFASAARPGVVALRAEGDAGRLRAGKVLRTPADVPSAHGVRDGRHWARVTDGSGLTAVAWQRQRRDGDVRVVDRVAVLAKGRSRRGASADRLDAARRLGFDGLLAEHRAVWADRWAAVDVEVPGDPEVELAVRFALFQLWGNVGGGREAAVGARGLSGQGYSGHVFWDADVFVLPAARANARTGARFPWESASGGQDVTPTSGHIGGAPVRIRTGSLEEHITADVAWSVSHYATWTGRPGFLRRHRALLEETARYWTTRCRSDAAGRAHVDDVIGPDEYHEAVCDNAFTNVMARWNLRAAADVATSPDEARAWRDLAAALVDGHHPDTGLYEQFAGYFDLEPLLVSDIARAPVAADVLLGRERLAATQIIKQPDVLMLHHLVPDEVAPGSLAPNLDFYGPRTAHGSSLSPAISASLLARAGRADEALRLLRTALRIDLDDLTGTTAAGLHLATMGGVWQAVLFGFAGVRVRDGVLCVDPVLPSSWPRLAVRFRCLGTAVRLHVTDDGVRVDVDAPRRVSVHGRREVVVAGSTWFERGRP